MRYALRKWFVGFLILLFALPAIYISFYSFNDYSGYFHSCHGMQTHACLQRVAGDSTAQKYWLTLTGNGQMIVHAGLLIPTDSSKKHPAIVLLGGKATGKYAIDYALGISGVIILALDYPYEPRESYSPWTILTDVPRVRQALVEMVPSAILAINYLCCRQDVDTTKLIVLGYSFGAPFVPVIVAHDRRAAAAAVVYGGGELSSLIRHNVARYKSVWLSELVGRLGGALLHPLEPLRYAGRISPTPLIMINGEEDEQIPRYNTELLFHAAAEPKKLIWLRSRHVRTEDVELTRRIIDTLKRELQKLHAL